MDYGGEKDAAMEAQRDLWPNMIEFLHETLQDAAENKLLSQLIVVWLLKLVAKVIEKLFAFIVYLSREYF
jgi:hypothetical protein